MADIFISSRFGLERYDGNAESLATLDGEVFDRVNSFIKPDYRQVWPVPGKPGQRWRKRPGVGEINLMKDFGIAGSGLADNTDALQKAMLQLTGKSVFVPAGIYLLSGPVQLPDNIILRFSKGAIIKVKNDFAPNLVNGNSLQYALLAGNNCTIENARIDVQNFAAGGIAAYNKTNVVFRNNEVKNWRGVFGICDIASRSVWYDGNTVTNGVHGLHSYKSTGVFMSENVVNIMSGGGIYTAWSNRVLLLSNNVSNCGDVGIDFEGGTNCLSTGNFVERCKNGELALFSGNGESDGTPNHLIHRGNFVTRSSTYVTGYAPDGSEQTAACDAQYGACSFMSVAPGSFEIGFENNRLNVSFGRALFHYETPTNDTADRQVFFTGNKIRSSVAFWRCLNSIGLEFTDNVFYGLTGAETFENELRDAQCLTFSGNRFNYQTTKTAGYVLFLNTVSGFAVKAPVLENNRFSNSPGLCIKVDTYNNFTLNPIIRNNDFGNEYTQNGGLTVTTNGFIVLKNQRLRIALQTGANDLSSLSALGRAKSTKGVGSVAFGTAGAYTALSTVNYLYGPGLAISAGIAGAGISATVNGYVLTLTGAGCVGSLDLELNTY